MEDKEVKQLLNAVNSKKKFSKKIVILVIMLNIIFTIAVFTAAFFNAAIPDSLIAAWFAFTTGELWFLSNIRRGENNE